MFKPEKLVWSVHTDRCRIGIGGGQRHLVIKVDAPRAEVVAQPRPPLNLGLVIDASGSMSGAPLAAAKEAARGVIACLNAGDRLTLLSFADDVVVHADAVLATKSGRRQTLQALDLLDTRGCTDLGAGWLAGCRCVATAMERTAPGEDAVGPTQNRVIILSDGHANRGMVDAADLAHHASELRRRGLYSSTVGIGDGYSPVQLDAIAEHGGGRSHDAPCGEDIVAVVMGELGEILNTVAEDMTVTVRVPKGMGVEVFGHYPVGRSVEDLRLALGSLVQGASRQLVLQLTVPPALIRHDHQIEVVPQWRDRDSGERIEGSVLRAILSVATESEVVQEKPDPELGQLVARMWQNHLRFDSTLLNTAGRCSEAESLVREAMPEIRGYCRQVPGAADIVDELEGHGAAVGVAMAASESLACLFASKASLKSDRDFRINKRR